MIFRRKKPPRLSIIVVAYDMPRQALNTLLSLSPGYQQLDEFDYEVVLVENRSRALLDRRKAQAINPRLRYYLRDELQPSPVGAINFGLAKARGNYVAVMIDGARLVTPGIIRHTLQAFRISDDDVVGTPGYHLGTTIQQESTLAGYDEAHEQQLLDSVDWPHNGYGLFDISCLSRSCREGVFAPLPETNWLAMSRQRLLDMGGYHTGFNSHGGGYANHDAWRRACDLADSIPVVLASEGCFHQYHGGVTTDARNKDVSSIVDAVRAQYRDIRGAEYAPPARSPVILGKTPYPALQVMVDSLDFAQQAHGHD